MATDESATPEPTPSEVFELLGHETRAEILRVLAEARGGDLPPALSFSELRDRLGVDTRSSQFNYHLDRLCGTFVEDRSAGSGQLVDDFVGADEGYALGPTGTLLTRLVTATSAPEGEAIERGPLDAGAGCHVCGAGLRARYANRTFRVWCPDCDRQYVYTLTPPGLVAGDPDAEELLGRADAYLRRKYTTFARGTCPLCAGAAPPEVVAPGRLDWPAADRLDALVRRRCVHCGNLNYALVGTELLADPGVVAFCHETGLDGEGTRLWALPFAVTDRRTTVETGEPWRATLTLRRDGETVAVTVDERLSVVERRRS